MSDPIVETAIRSAGGVVALAKAAGVKPSSVCKWRRNGVPAARARAISLASGVPLSQLRPDLWGPEAAPTLRDAPAQQDDANRRAMAAGRGE